MDTNTYPVDISILLGTVGSPSARITVGNYLKELMISEDTWIDLKLQGSGLLILAIEHFGKKDSDPDTALIIKQIRFNQISDLKFVYNGVYLPNYPKHLLGQHQILQQSYLSWNGIWTLDFTLPIYTWIHKTKNLGWIYD